MDQLALLVLAAVTFSLLAGILESRHARRARRRLLQRSPIPLHPLTHHPLRTIRESHTGRMLHYAALFLGFLIVVYGAVLLVRTIAGLLGLGR